MGEERGVGLGALVHPVRVAVSGMTEGPGLFEMLVLIGATRSAHAAPRGATVA